jgi:hypothetical protein
MATEILTERIKLISIKQKYLQIANREVTRTNSTDKKTILHIAFHGKIFTSMDLMLYITPWLCKKLKADLKITFLSDNICFVPSSYSCYRGKPSSLVSSTPPPLHVSLL